jgi:hypothetical protein
MTIISVKEEPILPSGKHKHREILLKCDECGVEYFCKYKKDRALKSELHFCSKKCSSKSMSDGLLNKRTHDELIKKYGSSYVETEMFKKEREETWLTRYGVKNILSSLEIQEKIKSTNLERYGREVYAGGDDWESKLDRDDIARKAWLTKIKNGSCSKSAPEERLATILEKEFGKENIHRQILTIKQWIDFYIVSLDLYIQVDGIYWHGLNRDLEIIKLGKTSQDQKIYKQILRDEKLNDYMKNNNKKLVRITDLKIKNSSDAEILDIITGK